MYGKRHIPFDTAGLDLTADPLIHEAGTLAKDTVWSAVAHRGISLLSLVSTQPNFTSPY